MKNNIDPIFYGTIVQIYNYEQSTYLNSELQSLYNKQVTDCEIINV